MAKRRRVLVLEFPGEPSEQSIRDTLSFVEARLAAAGQQEVEVIVLTKDVHLREVLVPTAKSGPALDREKFVAMSEQMYEELTK